MLELEAENAVLQQAMRSLPQLHHDRAALMSMRERQKVRMYKFRDFFVLCGR